MFTGVSGCFFFVDIFECFSLSSRGAVVYVLGSLGDWLGTVVFDCGTCWELLRYIPVGSV